MIPAQSTHPDMSESKLPAWPEDINPLYPHVDEPCRSSLTRVRRRRRRLIILIEGHGVVKPMLVLPCRSPRRVSYSCSVRRMVLVLVIEWNGASTAITSSLQ